MGTIPVNKIHPWEVDVKGAMGIQRQIVTSLIPEPPELEPELIAGCDVSASKGDQNIYAAVVVFEFSTMRLVERSFAQGKAAFPYVPGLLSFHEGPVLLSAFEKLKLKPEAVIFDGQGIAHPRGVGLASHIGLFLDLPSVGCAKTRLVGDHAPVGEKVGDSSPLIFQGREVGAALRTKPNVKPVFVSPGHRMNLKIGIELVLRSLRGYRLPEPTRQADILVGEYRRGKIEPPEAQQQTFF